MKNFLISLTIFFLLTGTVFGAASLEDEKALYDSQAEKAKAAADALQLKINSVSEVKRALDEEAAAATFDYEKKQAELEKTLSEIEENEKKLTAIKSEYDSKHKVLEKRVRDIYINGQLSYIDVIFGANDFGDFLTRMDLLKRVILQDSELVTSLLNYQGELQDIGKKLDEDRRVKENLATKAEQAKNIQLEKVAAQQELINKMQYDKEVFEQQYDEKMAAAQEIANLIEENRRREAARTQGYVSGSGSMIFPVSGAITDSFGWRTHPIFNRQIFHSGIDIGADYGEPIVAAQSGVVIHAGWIDGYGNTVIIDHGNGIESLYGHNQSLAVSEGQSVSQGQVISYCGSTGNSTGPHCHFEVLENDSPVDPNRYL